MALGGLSKADVARLLVLPSGDAPSDELVETVWGRTEGNPFFVPSSCACSRRKGA